MQTRWPYTDAALDKVTVPGVQHFTVDPEDTAQFKEDVLRRTRPLRLNVRFVYHMGKEFMEVRVKEA